MEVYGEDRGDRLLVLEQPSSTINTPVCTHRQQESAGYAFLCSKVISYRRNFRNLSPSRPKTTNSDPADLSGTQRINYSYAKMHKTAARGLTRDTTVASMTPPF